MIARIAAVLGAILAASMAGCAPVDADRAPSLLGPPPAGAGRDGGAGYRPADRVISLDIRPDHILHHDGRIYVSSFHDRQLLVLDDKTGRLLHRFDTFDHFTFTNDERDKDGKVTGQIVERRRCRPGDMVVAGEKLFVVQTFGSSLLVFHAPALHLIGRVEVGSSSGRLAASPDGRTVYFASNREKAFHVIDARTHQARRVGYPEGGRGIGALAAAPDGKRLYLGIQRGAREAKADPPDDAAGPVNPLKQTYSGPLLAVYDLATGRYVAIKSIGDTLKARGDDSSIPAAMAFGPDGRTLYIAMSQCMVGVHVYDTVDDTLRQPITLASVDEHFTWPACRDVAVLGDELLVVVGANHELAVLDRRTGRRRMTAPVGRPGGESPGEIAVSARHVTVCNSTLRRLFVFDLSSSR